MAQDALNRDTDLRTNQAVDSVAITLLNADDLAELRRHWADLPMIPRVLPKREDGVDNSWPGFDLRTLLLGEESGGRFTFHDIVVRPGAVLAAHHLADVDNYWYVVGGELELTIGDRAILAGPDTLGYAPRDTTQAIANRSDDDGRVIMWQSPAGYERAFAELHRLTQEQPDISESDCRAVLGRYGYQFHEGTVRLPNDTRVNARPERLEVDVQSLDDFNRLRADWARQRAVPRLVIERDQCPDIPMDGQDTKVLISGDESAGEAVVFHLGVDAGYLAVPHHQPAEEEIFLVLEGEVKLTVGNQTVVLGPGGFGFAPRNGTHSFQNPTAETMRMVTINAPAGHERGFEMIVKEAGKDTFEAGLLAHGWRVH